MYRLELLQVALHVELSLLVKASLFSSQLCGGSLKDGLLALSKQRLGLVHCAGSGGKHILVSSVFAALNGGHQLILLLLHGQVFGAALLLICRVSRSQATQTLVLTSLAENADQVI